VEISQNFKFPEKKWMGHSAECLDGRQRDFESYLSDLILVSPPIPVLYDFLVIMRYSNMRAEEGASKKEARKIVEFTNSLR
jgi:hypothetical protein